MDAAHHLVLLAGVPELPSIFAGLFSARFGTPILLMFLAIGMLFGKEGPVSLVFNCTQTAYLIGSAALAVNPVRGGLKTKRSMLKIACGGGGAAIHPAKSLVSYQGYRQFPAWNLPPLVMQALGAHGLL
jgi:NhaP-type Na+/H+ and K+/H+ antiporter